MHGARILSSAWHYGDDFGRYLPASLTNIASLNHIKYDF
ncbi:MAG: hypothetical protein RLZZ601_527 [Pseudomonadota bacterium]|jgi:hypothetical protein